ncbi:MULTISPECIES: EAL domain-containing protein [unclassified Paenibacillus]|uniref:bifunctional diguanylate cyclase/phosphodiesterase n=1 Tax=unclassified Paenibacillus TaxID=185978 RepID=UPI0015A29257|nr:MULTISPECIES: EAL domain-containing protein [unclassified Paenibacillus]
MAANILLIMIALVLPFLLPAGQLPTHWSLILHTTLETIAVLLSVMIFLGGWISARIRVSPFAQALSSLFLCVGLLEFAHMLSYNGMPGLLLYNGPHTAVVFGLAARSLVALSLLTIVAYPWTRTSRPQTRTHHVISGGGLLLTVAAYVLAVHLEDWLSPSLLKVWEYASFRLAVELPILALLVLSVLLVQRKTEQRQGQPFDKRLVFIALLLALVSEASLTFYQNNSEIHILLAHICKIAAYSLIFRAVLWPHLHTPPALLRQKEGETRNAQNHLHATLESIYDAVIITDRLGSVTYANPASAAFFRLSAQAMAGMAIEALFKIKSYDHPVKSCLASGQSSGIKPSEVFLPHEERWVTTEYSVSPIIGEQQEMIGTVLVFRDITERIKQQQNQQALASIIESASDFIAMASADGKALYYNKTARTMLGIADDADLSAISVAETHPAWAKDVLLNAALPEAEEHGMWNGESAFLGKRGEEIPVSQAIMSHRNEKNELLFYSTIARSLSEMRLAERKERLAVTVFENIADGIMVTDNRQMIQYVNPAFTQITGFEEQDIVGASPKILSSGKHDRAFYDQMWSSIRSHGSWQGEIWNRRKNGDVFLESITITGVKDGAQSIAYYIGVFKDVTLQKQLEAKLQHQAFHDAVTGLPNRLLLYERMEKAMRSGNTFAVLFLDLDRFKRINDTLGHSVGDQVLNVVAERLNACLRTSDTVARTGGDEFILLLDGLNHPEDSAVIAQKIILELSAPIFLDRFELYITVSIGISFCPRDGKDIHTLIKHADQAMYSAKEQGRNNFQVFSPVQEDSSPQLLSLEVSLRRALSNEELKLHYQPQIDSVTQNIIGLEALVRWSHPEWGPIPPAKFIPLAEESGLIKTLDQWVIREACRQLRRWLDEGYKPVPVSVNVSMMLFRQPNLAVYISQAMTDSGLPPHYLGIEITESTVMSNPEIALQTLHALKEMGIRISLDDFGVGYSSLNHLKKLPIDTLKIDRSFVQDIPEDAEDKAIVQSVIQLGRNLGLYVIAEGVEAEEQLAHLQSLQCQAVQGFLFSKPLPEAEVVRFFQKG